ncbi:DDE-type integrase/transposase/recombinase [Paenibacillus alba]|uniref:DDE-type integrase/transposase/recombinase n=1 Tax=Paenibacillus alba TaxID=1197127 RepID=A0ABU6GAK2_9BACL|nr:DDE-type integrase/transposase/recombinase [Paenibacillus alba]MEC0229764.1 DDE-type integrase/transposase/recombinase [Paenibacillus alba]
MDSTLQEQLAAFRYSLIAPIVCRQTPMQTGELQAYLEQTSDQTYRIPGSNRTQVSVRTLERYLSQYRRGEWDALKPKPRGNNGGSRLDPAVREQAIQLRKERPERSVEQIIFLLEESGAALPGTVAASTLARHLKKAGATRIELQSVATGERFRRYEAEDIHLLWQFDYKHFVYLPDPKDPKKKKKTILFAILDDYSRVIVQAQFYWDEKLPRTEDSLKKAILRYGIPEQFYCDNGAAFSSHHLTRICGRLGVRLSHSKPYRSQGRGKIERFFQFVDTSFKPEVYQQVENGSLQTIEDLNKVLWSWLDGYYHKREHGTTKESPAVRAEKSSRTTKRKSLDELTEIFLWEETRTVDGTSCVSLQGNSYEVDGVSSGQKVQLRYDPFDLSLIQVWSKGMKKPNAKPMTVLRYQDRRIKPQTPEPAVILNETEGQLSFFELAEQKRREGWGQDPLEFAPKQGGEQL